MFRKSVNKYRYTIKYKYKKGVAACGNCDNRGNHQSCRPRLDGTLCTCSCPRAEKWREMASLCGGDVEAARDYMDKGSGRSGIPHGESEIGDNFTEGTIIKSLLESA